jgi:PAS domain S-box-containing protein
MRSKPSKLWQTLEAACLVVALALVLAIAGASYQAWRDYGESRREMLISASIRVHTMALLSALKDAESGQRGFLLTGDERFLQPHRDAVRLIPERLKGLTEATTRRPTQRARLDQLRPLLAARLRQLEEAIELRRDNQTEAAWALVRYERSKPTMDEIRALGEAMETVATERYHRMAEDVEASIRRLGWISTGGSVALFGFLVLAAVTIRRGLDRRQKLIASLEESERATTEARDWLQTTLSSIGDGVIATDGEGRIAFLNGVAEKLTGWKQEEAKGTPLEDAFVITNEHTGETVENPARRALREGRVVGLANHTKLTAKDGREFPIDDSAAPIRDGSGKVNGVVLVFRDVTERKEAEIAREHSLRQFRVMADHAPVLVWIAGTDQRWTWLNQVWLDFVGRPLEEELAGERARNIHPDDREPTALVCEAAFRSRRAYSAEYRMRRHDGVYCWMLERGAPLYDAGGEFSGFIGSCMDISHQKTVEEKLLRANEDLHQFAYAASHDLQEPLRMITSYSQLLVQGYRGKLDEESALSVGFITEGTRRMRDLLSDLLAYTQVGTDGFRGEELVDLNAVFQMAVANLKVGIDDSRAEVTSERLPRVRGHAAHFAQLFQNLIGNAIKYRSLSRPVVQVTVRRQGGEWQFAVIDNGLGIDAEYHEKIFGVFKRLHGKDIPGTGIGLSICQRVVERYDGRIWVNSELGRGSKFYFTLPVAEGS